MDLKAEGVRRRGLPLAMPLRPYPGWERTEMTVACQDCDSIPKVSGAGGVNRAEDGTVYQVMHNGVRVLAGAYHGEWMSEVIRRLRGHHEPQEELIFDFAVRDCGRLNGKPIMVELGAFWGYYSLWFKSVHENSRNILVEPDPNSLEVGRRNFELNGWSAEFLNAAVGERDTKRMIDFICESDGQIRPTRVTSIDELIRENDIDRFDMLHADIQGAEMSMLEGAQNAMNQNRIGWMFLSTHHHSISGDPLTHHRCLQTIESCGGHIVAEHSISESFSGDGLIVARFGKSGLYRIPAISRNIAARSLFGELEFDLAQAWSKIKQLQRGTAAARYERFGYGNLRT